MAKGILGRKLGMTQIFSQDGLLIPVTVIEAGPCTVVQKKNMENDQYLAVNSVCERRERLFNKPERGHFAKANVISPVFTEIVLMRMMILNLTW